MSSSLLSDQKLSISSISKLFTSTASSSGGSDSLVALHFLDIRAKWMRHWWDFCKRADCAQIKSVFDKFSSLMRLRVDRGLREALASFWDPTHCCFSIGAMDLVPTLEEYAELLQLSSPSSERPFMPNLGFWSNRVLEKFLGLTSEVLRWEIRQVEETWRKASISLDFLKRNFSWSDFPTDLIGDFSVGERDWEKFRVNAFKIAFAGIFLFPTSAGRIDLGVFPLIFSEDKSIVPAILCETVRSLSYYRSQGEGLSMFCAQLLPL